MQEYKNKEELIAEIEKTAHLFITEFDSVEEGDQDKILEGVDRSPAQMIAYQLGWMNLLLGWDRDELAGKEVVTPALNYKWNKLGGLYENFYKQYEACTLSELKSLYRECVAELILWLDSFSDEDLFGQDVRKWASSTPSKWPIWKWIHINTVAPFQTFRSKIRKWKKLNRAAIQ
ncbi:ClbS/DfsB family four-helix bundle protein [Lacrimispora sp. JR3]|uniref:ClbS/DfsB family four-helix bundle protein n=1 Tax=Lacrimispora sinapis TaxID=3111456 RepID=UPI00374A6DA0